jgi:hypothetical protein
LLILRNCFDWWDFFCVNQIWTASA